MKFTLRILFHAKLSFESVGRELPWWSSGKESACLCKGHRFHPRFGKILYAVRQLSLCTTTREATTVRSPSTAARE